MDLRTVIGNRVTARNYTEDDLSLLELSFLLWSTEGVKKVTRRPVTLRTIPSAGARHAFETILLINKVDGLENGLYRYAAVEHALIRLEAGEDVCERLTKACLDQTQVRTSTVTFVWVAVVERMTWRYPERRLSLFISAGCRACVPELIPGRGNIECGVCAIAAYEDQAVNQVVGVDGDEQFAIYIASLGKVKK